MKYNIILYCIPEASAAKPVFPGDPYKSWGVLCGGKISAAKAELWLESEVDDKESEVEGGGGLGGGIEASLDFLDSDFSTDGGFVSNTFESEKMIEETEDIPEDAPWKIQYTQGIPYRRNLSINCSLTIILIYLFYLPVLGAGHDWLDSGCPKTDVNDLSSTNALLVLVLNPLLIQLLVRGADILSTGAFCVPGAENISANGLLNWSKSSEVFVDD